MELHQAQAFVAVARQRSFTRASARLHRSQPAVSQAVAALERELRAPLFERLPREARLTATGEALLARLEPLLGAWEEIGPRVVEDLSRAPSGVLRIGAGETALLHLLPAAVADFRARHPAVRLELRHQRRDESLRDLLTGSLDLAVRALAEIPAGSVGLVVEPLDEVRRVVAVAAGHPLAAVRRATWQRLAAESWVLPPAGSEVREEVGRRIAAEGRALHLAVETGGWELVKRYVALGLGLSVVPELVLTRADRRRIAVVPVAPALPPERYALWMPRDSAARPAARAFAEALQAVRRAGRAGSSGPAVTSRRLRDR